MWRQVFKCGVFWRSTTEKHLVRPLRFPGNVHLVTSEVGMIHIYKNKNEEQLEGFPRKFSKSNTLKL